MANDKILNMKLPSELDSALKQAADERYISQASLVRMVLAEWVKYNGAVPKKQETSVDDVFNSLPGFVTSGGAKHGG